MQALLIKPAALKTGRGRRCIAQLESKGAIRLQGSTATAIKAEITALEAKHGNVLVVACGGDGTVHLALNAIAGTDANLAVIPMGTGNDFARYLGIDSARVGLKVLETGQAVPIDVGRIELESGEVRHYLGIASCGFDAQVNERANGYRGPSGTVKYLAAVLTELRALQAKELSVHLDSTSKFGQFTLVAIGNTNSYGGGMRVCPTANAFDGQFEVTFVDRVSRNLLIRVLPRVFWGGHVKHPRVTQGTSTKVSVSGEDFLIYADGERVGAGPARFSVLPQFIRVWQVHSSLTP